ncbi:serine carboxypeptidase S28 [Xylariaceae sp. FL0255]|nr:serine carboxypeptidase S28 [Xylariaceae sp. FL0255]
MDDTENTNVGASTFKQWLDYEDHSKGTFSQRYWYNAEFYKQGGPIFLFSPGEQTASNLLGYLENTTLPGRYAQEFNGAVVMLEHRYWGKSIPYDTLTAETLQYLNLPNAIADQTNFAESFSETFCGDACSASQAPWVLVGGSYSGALTAWTQQKAPGTFAAYHASSAVVEAIYDFYTYYSPIEEGISTACANDLKAVVSYVDGVLDSKNTKDINILKSRFGLQTLGDANFAEVLASPFGSWQEGRDEVDGLCNLISQAAANATSYMKNTSGVGLVAAIQAYATWVKKNSGCGDGGKLCDVTTTKWNTPNTLDDNRPWEWLLCNEPFGWWQVGPPESDGDHIVSAALQPNYYQETCPLQFPKTNGFQTGSADGFTEDHLNLYTGGWDASFEKVLFVQGQYDPWRSATIGSDFRPGGPVASSDAIPNLVVEGGLHCADLVLDPPTAEQQPVLDESIKIMGAWLKEWTKPSGKA